MKKIIEKLKDFIVNSTPAAKLKYGIISVLTVAVAVSVIAVVAMNTSEPEKPEIPDGSSSESVTIEFDNEIVIDIVDDSKSDNETDTDTSTETKSESTTDDSEPIEETTDEVTENTTEETTAKETEKAPSDPQSIPSQEEPRPVETTAAQTQPTEVTVKQTTPAPRPAETTAKQTQAEPKPVETTEKQTHPAETTKPAETTVKHTEAVTKPAETTKPVEQPPQQTGQFILKEKKYEYKGADVSILHVENKSQKAYTITLTATYKDSNGKELKTEKKTFEGFPAGWSNYFVFNPGIKYDSVSLELAGKDYKGKTLVSYLHIGNNVEFRTFGGLSDGKGTFIYAPGDMTDLDIYTCVTGNVGPVYHTFNGLITYSCDIVFFDSNGDICLIGSAGGGQYPSVDVTGTNDSMDCPLLATTILWKNKDQYKIPDNLKNASAIVGVKYIAED